MSTSTRQRLIGILVILCLVLVIWPLVTPNSPDSNGDAEQFQEPPPLPATRALELPEAFQTGRGSDAGSGKAAVDRFPKPARAELRSRGSSAAVRGTPQATSPARPAKDAVWKLRVGIFAAPENVLKQLRKGGYTVRQEAWKSDNSEHSKPLYAVYVGAPMTRAKAERLKKNIDQRYQLQAVIESAQP